MFERVDTSSFAFLLDVFKQHRICQLEARLQAGDKWGEQTLVFCNIYGRFFDTAVLQKLFVKLLKEQRLPPNPRLSRFFT